MDVDVQATIDEEDLAALKELAARRGVSANTILKQAIQTEKLFSDEVDPKDKVLIEKADGSVRRVTFTKKF